MNGNSTAALNRLLTTLYRSLPMYLADADPWSRYGDSRAREVLETIVMDQRRDCERIAAHILDRYDRIETGAYPMEFTDLNFLSLDYLVQELIEHQRETLATIQQCIAWLQHDPAARTLAQEVLGSERAHLEMLEDLTRQAAA